MITNQGPPCHYEFDPPPSKNVIRATIIGVKVNVILVLLCNANVIKMILVKY